MKRMVFVLIVLLGAGPAYSAEGKIEYIKKIADPDAHEIVENSTVIGKVCIEGHLFVFADFITSTGSVISKTGGGFNLVQVYEEINGRTVPKKCRMPKEGSEP